MQNFVFLQLLFIKAYFWNALVHTWFLRVLGQACVCAHIAREYIALVLSRMHDAWSLWRSGSQQSRHKLFKNRSGPMSLCNQLPRNLKRNPPGKITVTGLNDVYNCYMVRLRRRFCITGYLKNFKQFIDNLVTVEVWKIHDTVCVFRRRSKLLIEKDK